MAVEFQDYYTTLGVPRDAIEADIKKAFRKLARQHHPDIAKARKNEERALWENSGTSHTSTRGRRRSCRPNERLNWLTSSISAHFNSASDGALKALNELRANAVGDRRQGCSRPAFQNLV